MKQICYIYTLLLGLLFIFFTGEQIKAQEFKQVCVLGSSTSYGYFGNPPLYPSDSSWPNKIKKYYKNLGVIDTLFNLSVIGTDPYHAMPDSYVPPPGRAYPDPLHNITKAVNLIPRPDVIIVNFPTNHFDYFSLEEVIDCFSTIQDIALANGIMCYIATTQPRNTFSPAERLKLKELRDLIIQTFGSFAIDFYSDIVEEGTLYIDPAYSLGDNVHINAAGHSVLYNKVLEKNIFFGIIAVNFQSVKAVRNKNHISIEWDVTGQTGIEKYIIERSSNGNVFNTVGELAAGLNLHYVFNDNQPPSSRQFYRITAKTDAGQKIYSEIVVVDNPVFFDLNIYPTVTSGQLHIRYRSNESQAVLLKITDMEGKVIMSKREFWSSNELFPFSVLSLAPGSYIFSVAVKGAICSRTFIRL